MLPFDLPPPKGFSSPPIWDGRSFLLDNYRQSVLEYSENFSGWSDDLTALHEEAAGNAHPIDIASRKDAIKQVGKYLPEGKPVVMEIGCSSGFFIKDLVETYSHACIEV